MGKDAKDPEAMKQEAKATVTKQFVDHLAGHEDKIAAGMEDLSKYQKKFRSLRDTRDVPKHRPNEMKGKPFVEHLVPGMSFQVSRKHRDWIGLDVSPYIAYKISGRWRVAAGTTYHLDFATKKPQVRRLDKEYGYRLFTQVKVWRGLAVHLEGELIKSTIPPYYITLKNLTDTPSRLWIHRAHIGVSRNIRITRHWDATTLVLYDFLKTKENFHFNKVAFRVGFEYRLKSKKKNDAPSATGR